MSLIFILPTGERASLSREQARTVADRLWDLGTTPGAPSAAARIMHALRASQLTGERLEFEKRELDALWQAADPDINWSRPTA